VEGQVLRENTVMLAMCKALGFDVRDDPSDSELKLVTLPIAGMREETRATA
jgi:acetyltransferase